MNFNFGDLVTLDNNSVFSGESVTVCGYVCTFIKDGVPTRFYKVKKEGEGYFTDSDGELSKYTYVPEYELNKG